MAGSATTLAYRSYVQELPCGECPPPPRAWAQTDVLPGGSAHLAGKIRVPLGYPGLRVTRPICSPCR
jgi:hypothetical protein